MDQYQPGGSSCPTGAADPLANAASNPAIAGLMLRVQWKDIEPSYNVFNFSSITDCVFNDAEASTSVSQPRGASGPTAHKFVVLAFVPGYNAPGWALTDPAGKLPPVATASFCVPYGSSNAGSMQNLPLPWDPTYQNNWSNFLQAVQTHYASKADLLMIAAAGPTSVSDEISLPGAEGSSKCSTAQAAADQTTWENLKPPYTPSRYEGAWTTAFDGYASDFPNQFTSLSLYPGLPIGGKSTFDSSQRVGTPQAILNAGSTKFGSKFAVQMNGLTYNSGGPTDSMYQLVSESSGKMVTGFQLVESATKDLTHIQAEGGPSLTAADGATALNNALQAGLLSKAGVASGVDFLQIYGADTDTAATNSSVQTVLASVAGELPLPQYSPAYLPPPPPKPGCGYTTGNPDTCI